MTCNRYHLWAALDVHAFSKAEAVLRFSAEEDGMWVQWQDYARLKSEVERLKVNSGLDQKTIRNLQQTPEWSEITRLTADYRALQAENARLRASSFVTAVPVEQYERLIKAGDAMADAFDLKYPVAGGLINAWNAAKEGKPSV
jgi:hypothetical protein